MPKCWQEASVPRHVGLSVGLFEYSYDVEVVSDPRKSKAEAAMFFK